MKKTTLRRIVMGLLLVLGAAMPPAALAGPAVKVDILFMNHGPMQPVIKSIKEILARHAQAATADWYDFETPPGRDFMRQKGLRGHIPLLIFLNGSPTWQIKGRKVTFIGFPDGYGPYQFRGQWSLEDLERLLASLARGRGAGAGRP